MFYLNARAHCHLANKLESFMPHKQVIPTATLIKNSYLNQKGIFFLNKNTNRSWIIIAIPGWLKQRCRKIKFSYKRSKKSSDVYFNGCSFQLSKRSLVPCGSDWPNEAFSTLLFGWYNGLQFEKCNRLKSPPVWPDWPISLKVFVANLLTKVSQILPTFWAILKSAIKSGCFWKKIGLLFILKDRHLLAHPWLGKQSILN